jgi:hypothetical protein
LRTSKQKNARKIATRVVSVFCMVVAVAKAIQMFTLGFASGNLFLQFEPVYIWALLGGAFMGLSRIWGELAEKGN